MASRLKDSDDHGMLIQVLEHLLEACIVEQDQSSLPSFGSKQQILFVSHNEVPALEDSKKVSLIKLLLAQRADMEVDRVKYCIRVYDRCVGKCPSKWSPRIWQGLCGATQEAVSMVVSDVLIKASSSQGSDDLFSGYNQGSCGDISTFLKCISNWSEDGLVYPLPLFQATMKCLGSSSEGKIAVIMTIRSSVKDLEAIKRPDEIFSEGRKVFAALESLMSEVSVLDIIGERLLQEVIEGSIQLGNYFEKESILCSLLSRSTIINHVHPLVIKNSWYSCFTSIRGFPTCYQADVDQIQSAVQDGLHKCHTILHSSILLLLKRPSAKSNVLSWLAAIVSLNESRAGPKYELKKGNTGTCSDGFLVNFCAVLLHFCQPFFSSHPSGPKLPLIVPDYPSSPSCRLDLHNETCLAHGIITNPERQSQDHTRFQCLQGNFKFVTEIFFITLRALHIGLLPAADTFLKTLSNIAKEMDRKGGQEKLLSDLNGLYLMSGDCCLLDPLLVQKCSEFYITNAVWLTMLMESCKDAKLSDDEVCAKQRKIFSMIPEHAVKDMVRWFLFVLRTRAKRLQGLQLTPFVDCCISLLERPDLLPGPVAQSQIISVLLACVGRDRGDSTRLLSTDSWGGIRGELAAMVQGSPAFQSRLGPALLHTFTAVGVVEGLDVDKEDFDKYSARYDITQLLLHLWTQMSCRESIIQQAGTQKFSSFLGAIFDTLLYQLNDSMTRITNVHRMELEKENIEVWSKLSGEETRMKESFLVSERRASKQLLKMGTTLLSLLESITEVESIRKHFITPPLAVRTASAMMGFLDNLCGARQAELKVKDPDQLKFDPRKLVAQLATVIVNIWRLEKTDVKENGFMLSLAAHPDYSRPVFGKVASVLERHQLCGPDIINDYKSLLVELDKKNGPGDPMAQVSVDIGGPGSGYKSGTVADWQRAIDSRRIDTQSLHEMYTGTLQGSVYDSASLEGAHSLEDRAVPTVDPRSPRLLAILRDIKQLQESLSVHPDSSIYVRQDEDRMDLVRVLITGPVDTPYSYGCFVFDVFYPTNYPVDPPLVLLTTTGNGTIRFNPNLYADGKVCLSLLGTWHGGDSSEKWNPLQSNLLQVLISIQGLILIPEPIYNEPGYEAMQGTPQGNVRSSHYNAYIQVNTVRYAMLEQLRHPPAGFEDAVNIHFMLLRDVILQQCSKWLKNTVSIDHEQKLRKAVNELREELEKI